MRRSTKLGILCILTAILIFISFHIYYYTLEKNADEMLTNYFEISQKKQSYNYEDVSLLIIPITILIKIFKF